MSSPAARRIRQFVGRKTVWHEFTGLAASTGSVNLGQGFPTWPPPAFATDALVAAARSGAHHTYSRSAGAPRLVRALAGRYSSSLGRRVDAEKEVVVTAGATEALFNALQGLVDPGDEVVLFAPAFDIYTASVETAGGAVVAVPYRPAPPERGGWAVDMDELERAISPRAKVLLLNSPANPSAVVWDAAQLEALAAVVRRHPRLVVVSDEVYEHIVFQGAAHVPFASLPGMYDRTVTVSSAGKVFSTTGWKVGWAVGPPALVEPVAIMKQWTSFSTCSVVQEAVAAALEACEDPYEGHSSYLEFVRAEYTRKRGILLDGLAAAGLHPLPPQGSFFVLAQTDRVRVPERFLVDERGLPVPRDFAFCRFMASEVRVVAIPPSAFHTPENAGMAAGLARFAFCKTDEELHEACRRMLGLRAFLAEK